MAIFAIVFTAFAPAATAQKFKQVAPTTDILVPEGKGDLDTKADTLEPETTCSDWRSLEGNHSNSSNNYGNTRNYTSGTPDFIVSAWEKNKSNNVFNTAFLGHYGSGNGVGVSDREEGVNAGDPAHRVDNYGNRHNYVVIRFAQNVTIGSVELAAIQTDSDITAWIGTVGTNYPALPALSDAMLASFGPAVTSNSTASSGSRSASVNPTSKVGNVLVVAARVDDSDGRRDQFKVKGVQLKCPSGGSTVTIIKSVESFGVTAHPASFGFTATGAGMQNFSLVDNNVVGPDRHIRTVTQYGTSNQITVKENTAFGWSLNDIRCTNSSGVTVTIASNLANGVTIKFTGSGQSATCTFVNGLNVPSAAKTTISGRAMLASGRGASNAELTLFDLQTGETRIVRTNSFGYYQFDEVEVEKFYVLSISHLRYSFELSTRQFTLMDQIADMDFVQAF